MCSAPRATGSSPGPAAEPLDWGAPADPHGIPNQTTGLRRRRPTMRMAAGFTMLEVIVVLSIMVLIIGIGVSSFQTFDEKGEFDEPTARLAQMAKFSLQAAMVRHRGISIGFDEAGFAVLGEGAGPGGRYTLPGGMGIKLLRLGSRDWEKADGQIWRFGEQGICEPIKVRFESENGIEEMAFHPLTGSPILEP